MEGVEHPGHRFALGVQWHPEYAVDPADPLIFRAFVEACRGACDADDGRATATRRRAERGERIAKWLARAGIASRRDAEKLIAEGRVRLGNRVVETPATFVQPGDLVTVDGKPVGGAAAHAGCSATTSRPGW